MTVLGFLAVYASEMTDRDGKPTGELEFMLHGGWKPTVFKTLTRARAATRHWWPSSREVNDHGRVLVLDVDLLPIVSDGVANGSMLWDRNDPNQVVNPDPVAGARAMDERDLAAQFELAERQMQIWTERCLILDREIKRRAGG